MALLLATVMVFTPFLKFLFALYQSPLGNRLLNQGNSQYDGPAKSRYLYPLYPPPEIFQVIIFPIKYRMAMHHFGTNPYTELTSLAFTFSSHMQNCRTWRLIPKPQMRQCFCCYKYFFKISALSVASQGKSRSLRPKCP